MAARPKDIPADRPPSVVKPPAVVRRSGELARGLRQNDIYREVDAALPSGIDPWDRDDIRSNMIEAVLSGQIRIDQIRSERAEYVRQHHRPMRAGWFDSIDRGLHINEGSMTLADTLTTNDMVAF